MGVRCFKPFIFLNLSFIFWILWCFFCMQVSKFCVDNFNNFSFMASGFHVMIGGAWSTLILWKYPALFSYSAFMGSFLYLNLWIIWIYLDVRREVEDPDLLCRWPVSFSSTVYWVSLADLKFHFAIVLIPMYTFIYFLSTDSSVFSCARATLFKI